MPLPRNNTDIAKQMRVGIVLGAIARLVVKFLFQPTYMLGERSGLRRLLSYQSRIDPLREAYARGILLSMKHEHQDDIDQGKVDHILDNLKDEVRVGVLFATGDDLEVFEEGLGDLLVRLQKVWQHVQRGKQKLEPSFDERPTTTKFPWYIVGLPAPPTIQPRASAPRTTADAQEDTIIVPQIVQIQMDGDPEPVTRGWVLQKAQIDAADEEIRVSRGARITPLVEDAPSRPRDRPRRSMSISGNVSPNLKKSGPFLSSGPAA